MDKVVIHPKTFCKDISELVKSTMDDMRKKNPELDKKIVEYERVHKGVKDV